MRQSLPDLALELSMDGIVLHQRVAPGQWAELGATRLDAPDLGANLRAMRGMAGSARGKDFRTQIWLPDEQVSTHNLLLAGETRKEIELSAVNALTAITSHRGEDFTIILGAPAPSGHTPVAAVLLQTLREAREFAENNGFRPAGFSSREAPVGFDFTPAFSEPVDFGPIKRKLSFAAGIAAAFLVGGTAFRIADPYEFWLQPPPVANAPVALPLVASDIGKLALGRPATGLPFDPVPRPQSARLAAASGKLPDRQPTNSQAGALVFVPRLQQRDVLRPPARPPVDELAIAPQFGKLRALFTPEIDRLPTQSGPRLARNLIEPAAPAFGPELSRSIARAADAKPEATPPVQFAAVAQPAGQKLPGPTITRAFALDNLDAIVALAENLARTSTTRKVVVALTAPPQMGLTGVTNLRTDPRINLPNDTALASPLGQPGTALPEIGAMAALRPFGKPSRRPPGLQTEGEFERAPEALPNEAPPLALRVPPGLTGPLAAIPPSDTEPQPPVTDLAGLPEPSLLTAEASPTRPGQEILAFAEPPVADRPAAPGTSGAFLAPTETAQVPPPDLQAAPPTELAALPLETQAAAEPPQNPVAAATGKPPRPRPASIAELAKESDQTPTRFALLNSVTPKGRTADFEVKAAARRRTDAVISGGNSSAGAVVQSEPKSSGIVFAAIPSSASVQRAATQEDALDRSKISLIGIYGSRAKRRALIRLPSGRFVRVEIGDKFSGYQVASIDTGSVRLLRSGKSQTLKMPR